MHAGLTWAPELLDRRVPVLPVCKQQPTSSKHPCLTSSGIIRRPKSELHTHGASLLASANVTPESSSTRLSQCDPAQINIKRRAKAARMAGQPQLALRILLDGLQQYPHDYHLIGAAASAAAKLGDAGQAFQILSPALQAQPHNVHLLAAAAQAHAKSGNPAAARQCLQTAAAAQPNNVIVLQSWGVLEASCGNIDTAVNLYKQAVAADPRHVPTYVAWARLEAERGRVREARSLHQQGHQANPQHAPNLHAWAELECNEGQWLLAMKLLQAAIQADRNHLPSWMALGKAHWSLGDSASARRVFQDACRVLGPGPELLNQWATLEQQAQRIPAARAVLGFMDQVLRPEQHHIQQQQVQEQQQLDSEQQQPQQQDQPSAGRRRRAGRKEQQQVHDSDQPVVGRCASSDHQPQQQQQQHYDSMSLDAEQGISDSSNGGPLARVETRKQLEQQVEQLVALLNAQGPAGRRAATAAAAGSASLIHSSHAPASLGDSTSSSAAVSQGNGGGPEVSSSGQSSMQQQHLPQQHQQQLQQVLGLGSSTAASGFSSISPSVPTFPTGLTCHIPALVNAAVMEQRAGNTNKALKLYQAALEAAPNNPKLLHAVSQLHLKRGDRAAAEVQLQELEQLDPCNGFLCHTRGILAQQEGQLGEAREWFVKGMKAQGSQPALLNYEALAELQAFMGDASGARATLTAGLNGRRPTARFLRMAGLVEKRLGDVDNAAKLLARAVAQAPRDYKSWLALAVLERRRGDFAAAARCFKRGTACAPCNPHLWYAWAAMTWKDCNDYRAARRLYEQATTYCPRNAPLWMEWAMLEWDEARNIERARQLFAAGAGVPHSYQHPPLYQAWAQREAAAGNAGVAEQLTARSFEVAKTLKRAKGSVAQR